METLLSILEDERKRLIADRKRDREIVSVMDKTYDERYITWFIHTMEYVIDLLKVRIFWPYHEDKDEDEDEARDPRDIADELNLP